MSDIDALVGHTPGPWKAGKFGSSIVGISVTGPEGRHIAGLGLPCQGEPDAIKRFRDEQHVNARLIAAAPDLLAALLALRDERDALRERVGEMEPYLQHKPDTGWCRMSDGSTKCRCGLDALLAAIAAST